MSTAPVAFEKDPDEILDYRVDWETLWLNGDTIATSSWTIEGPDANLTKSSEVNTTGTATVFLAGGTVLQTYRVVNRITTAGGRTKEQTLAITIKES